MYLDFTCTSLWVKWLMKLVISIKRPRTDLWLISKVSPSTTTGPSVFPMATVLQEKAGDASCFLQAVSLRPMFHEKPASCLPAIHVKTAVAQAVKALLEAHACSKGSQQKEIAKHQGCTITALFGKLYVYRVQAVPLKDFSGRLLPLLSVASISSIQRCRAVELDTKRPSSCSHQCFLAGKKCKN